MDKINVTLAKLSSQQEQGVHSPCPRCGLDRMDNNINRNALSRHEDIYICNVCGVDEALRDFSGHKLPLSDWFIMR